MIRVLHGDARAVLATLPGASVQCCVTSPPYFGLRDYGVAGQIGNEATPDAYIAALVAVFREVRRVLRDDGTLWLNLGDSYSSGSGSDKNPGTVMQADGYLQKALRRVAQTDAKPKDLMMIPARVALALQTDGWWLRSDIIWAKPNPMPESVTDRPTSSHEHVFLLTKSAKYFFDADAVKEGAVSDHVSGNGYARPEQLSRGGRGQVDGWVDVGGTRNIRNVWTIATAPYAEAHFATFPPELAERCIKAGTSERGCCAACGAPWARLQERLAPDGRKVVVAASQRHAMGDDGEPMMPDNRIDAGVRGSFTAKSGVLQRTDAGWSPSCGCRVLYNEGAERGEVGTKPCTVLDPFAGAFTAPMVADRLQRHAIGIELSADYVAMARSRLTKDAGMFADMSDT